MMRLRWRLDHGEIAKKSWTLTATGNVHAFRAFDSEVGGVDWTLSPTPLLTLARFFSTNSRHQRRFLQLRTL
jgi:hypothetical protein